MPDRPVADLDAPASPPFTADQLEAIFHAALKAGDAQGVRDALLVMAGVDVARCERLYASLTTALDVAQAVTGSSPSPADMSGMSRPGHHH